MFLENNNGVTLDQVKEPALSRDLIPFLSASTLSAVRFPALIPPSVLGGKEDLDAVPANSPCTTFSCSLEELIKTAKSANIIDERDGLPLASKLAHWILHPMQALVADAIDDEPFVSSQLSPLIHRSQEVVAALNLLADAAQAKDRYIAIYKNMYDLATKIPDQYEKVRVERLGGKYPMEIRATKEFGEDVLLIGTCALLHLYRAVSEGIPQTTAIVTVAGNCVGNPANLEVTIGTTISTVLERCGLVKEPSYIVEGGAMKGLCVIDPDHTIVKADTRAILAFHEDKKEQHYNCIGCGNCLEACPSNLNPANLYKSITQNRMKTARELGVLQCIGCSTCSYICPSKLDLSHVIYTAKQRLTKEN